MSEVSPEELACTHGRHSAVWRALHWYECGPMMTVAAAPGMRIGSDER
jgi:hypothetical protein